MSDVERSAPTEKTTDEVVWLDPQNPWFLLDEETTEGPFTLSELRSAMETGKVRGATYLWQEGLATWTRADSLERLGLLWEAAMGHRDLAEGRRPTRDTALVTLIASRRPPETTETRVERPVPLEPPPSVVAAPMEPAAPVAQEQKNELKLAPLGWIAIGAALASSLHFFLLLWWTSR